MRCLGLGAALLAVLAAGVAGAQQRCGLAKDLVVHAREEMTPASTAAELSTARQLLKRAAAICAEQGDAWYFQGLLDERAGKADLAGAERHRAELFGSEALKEKTDPFTLAVPKGTPPAGGGAGPGQRWAVVVGISRFADKNVDPLQFTSDDAQSFADTLRDAKVGGFAKDHVHVLLNEAATTRNLKVELNWLARSAGPDDIVVIYIATHGSPRSMDAVGANYVVTYDTEQNDEEKPDVLFATAFPMVDISNVVASRIKATRVAIFLDTCFSEGAMAGNAGQGGKAAARGSTAVSEQTLEHIRQGAGRMIFAASKTDQESMESTALKHGYFTYYLVDALRRRGGAAPLSTVYGDVREHVATGVAKDFAAYGLHQDPVMSRSEADTDFALGGGAAVARVGAVDGSGR